MIKEVEPGSDYDSMYAELAEVLIRYQNKVALQGRLAAMSSITGKLLAFTGPGAMTTDEALEVVFRNMEAGNKAAIDKFWEPKGNA